MTFFDVSELAIPIVFADDTNLFISDHNLSNPVKTAYCELDILSYWFKLNKLTLYIKRLILYSLDLQTAYTLKTLLSTLTKLKFKRLSVPNFSQ